MGTRAGTGERERRPLTPAQRAALDAGRQRLRELHAAMRAAREQQQARLRIARERFRQAARDGLLTYREAAAALGVTVDTLHWARRRGYFRPVRVAGVPGVFLAKTELDAYRRLHRRGQGQGRQAHAQAQTRAQTPGERSAARGPSSRAAASRRTA